MNRKDVERMIAEAVEAEREACALMCEGFGLLHIAVALRYRGKIENTYGRRTLKGEDKNTYGRRT